MHKVLITGVVPSGSRRELERLGLDLTIYGAQELINQSTFIEAIRGFDFYISGGEEKLTKEVLAAADVLKFIAFLGVDCQEYIDVPAAIAKGVKVCETPGANAVSVAEFAVGLMIDAQRRITASACSLMQNDTNYSTSYVIHDKTVGLIGMGPIGLRITEMCSMGLRANVIYWSRSGEKQAARDLRTQFVELDELVERADIISLQVPESAGRILDSKRAKKLKRGCTIVCIAPAKLCEPQALLNAMKNDHGLYAAFDCFYGADEEKESPAIQELRKLGVNRILITPHVAWRTFESDQACYDMAIRSLREFLGGLTPSNLIS
jgi:phosphoglycerate dehydrogenase-like enzyme